MYSPEELTKALEASPWLFNWLSREGKDLLDNPGFQVAVRDVLDTLKQEEEMSMGVGMKRWIDDNFSYNYHHHEWDGPRIYDTCHIHDRVETTTNVSGPLTEGLTLEKIQKAKEIIDRCAVPPEERFLGFKWIKTAELIPDMDELKEEIVGSLSLAQQQELYEFMHTTLGLRIYK